MCWAKTAATAQRAPHVPPKGGSARQRRQNTAAAAPTTYSTPAPAPKRPPVRQTWAAQAASKSHGGAPSKYASFPRHACPSPFLLFAALYRKAIKTSMRTARPTHPKGCFYFIIRLLHRTSRTFFNSRLSPFNPPPRFCLWLSVLCVQSMRVPPWDSLCLRCMVVRQQQALCSVFRSQTSRRGGAQVMSLFRTRPFRQRRLAPKTGPRPRRAADTRPHRPNRPASFPLAFNRTP